MAKREQAKYKISRRLGTSLWGRDKDPINVKNYPPGLHGAAGRRRATSDFGTQLMAKQQLRGYYGDLSEKRFRSIYKEASRRPGDTGEIMVGLLEQLLYVVVYRANFVPTIFAARQLVNHKHVSVNGQPVTIPTMRIKPGDVIEVRERSRNMPLVVEAVQRQEREIPDYIEVDPKALKATFQRVPTLAEIPYPVVMEPNLVVEFYSR